jgi:hypothetical protein
LSHTLYHVVDWGVVFEHFLNFLDVAYTFASSNFRFPHLYDRLLLDHMLHVFDRLVDGSLFVLLYFVFFLDELLVDSLLSDLLLVCLAFGCADAMLYAMMIF